MKLQGARKVRYDAGPNMIPLVDVVMVILIFFMLAGSFVGAEHYMLSDVPIQAKGRAGTAGGCADSNEVFDYGAAVGIVICRQGGEFCVGAEYGSG